MMEDATKEVETLEIQPKDFINQHQEMCEPATRNEPVRHPSPWEQVQTTTNSAAMEQNHNRYKLDAE